MEITIDFAAYQKSGPVLTRAGRLAPLLHSVCPCSLCLDQKRKNWIKSFGKVPQEEAPQQQVEDYRLLPARLLGYDFTTKIWGQFYVNRVKDDVRPDQNSFDRLIFPRGSKAAKEELKTLVMYHGKYKSPIEDPVAGKGQGLVILLHGGTSLL
jgi:hypothetical protein